MFQEYSLPENLNDYITNGIKRGKRIKRTRVISKISGMTAAVILTVFIGAIRVSPVFASYMGNIPGLEYLVKLISDDKGLQSAIQNDYFQTVNQSVEGENIILTVKDIIADQTNIIIFYSIENQGEYKWPQVYSPQILDADGNTLKLSSSYGYSPSDDIITEGKIVFNINQEEDTPAIVIPDQIIFSTQIAITNKKEQTEVLESRAIYERPPNNQKVLNYIFQIPITLNWDKFAGMEKVYSIGKKITVEGQEIIFDAVRIYPTRLELDLSFSPENTMKLFDFEDIKVMDEHGREWGTIMNGISGTSSGDHKCSLYFQSNYFTSPEKLYITGKSIRALHKESLEVVIDPDTKKFLKSPDDRLKLTDVQINGCEFSITYQLHDRDDKRHYSVFSSAAKDGHQNKLTHVASGSATGDGFQEAYVDFEGETDIQGPVTLEIWDYPNRIQGDFRVDILK